MAPLCPARLFVVSLSLLVSAIAATSNASTILVVPNANLTGGTKWQLTFEDNFNTVDTSRWRLHNDCSTNNNCAQNKELQVYMASQIRAEKGKLVIEATNQSYTSPAAGTRQYRSGRMDSSGSFAQQYGRFEARIKLPTGQGMWPAFCDLVSISVVGSGGRCWPTDGEIDIMEYIGNKKPKAIHGNFHFGQQCSKNLHSDASVCGTTGKAIDVALNNEYHVYAAEWTPTSISWFFDGQLYYKLDSSQCTNKAPFFIPAKPFYIIFNFAVGGGWPGNPTPTTIFPQRLYVDYVRVYKHVGAVSFPVLGDAAQYVPSNATNRP